MLPHTSNGLFLSQNESRIRKLAKKLLSLRLWWYSICAALCSWQLYHISDVYFSYATSVTIANKQTNFFLIPGITLCFNRFHLLQPSVLKRTYPKLLRELDDITNSN